MVAITRQNLLQQLQARGLQNNGKLYAVEVECPFCHNRSKITVREEGIRHSKTSYCTNYECRKRHYHILENLQTAYYKEEVEA